MDTPNGTDKNKETCKLRQEESLYVLQDQRGVTKGIDSMDRTQSKFIQQINKIFILQLLDLDILQNI